MKNIWLLFSVTILTITATTYNGCSEFKAGTSETNQTSVAANAALVSWDKITDSRLDGYIVSYRSESGAVNEIDVRNVTADSNGRVSVIIENLASAKMYYFKVAAYDNMGVESDYSTEVSKYVP